MPLAAIYCNHPPLFPQEQPSTPLSSEQPSTPLSSEQPSTPLSSWPPHFPPSDLFPVCQPPVYPQFKIVDLFSWRYIPMPLSVFSRSALLCRHTCMPFCTCMLGLFFLSLCLCPLRCHEICSKQCLYTHDSVCYVVNSVYVIYDSLCYVVNSVCIIYDSVGYVVNSVCIIYDLSLIHI